MPRPFVIATTATFLCVGVPCSAKTQDCADWNTLGFLEAASVVEVRLCLSESADIDARTALGRTALHWAAAFRTPEMVDLLLDARADARTRTGDGELPFDLARDNPDLKGSDAYWRLNDARFQ